MRAGKAEVHGALEHGIHGWTLCTVSPSADLSVLQQDSRIAG